MYTQMYYKHLILTQAPIQQVNHNTYNIYISKIQLFVNVIL